MYDPYAGFGKGFASGCFLTFFVCLMIIIWAFGENRPNLETCAKKYNVFECEWVAVPKQQEKAK